jgi:peroxiredoxin
MHTIMKKVLQFALPLLAIALASCSQSGKSVSGTVSGANNLQVALDQIYFDRNSTVALGKTACDASGKFEVKSEKALEEGLYRLSIGAKKVYFILDGKESGVDISGNLETIDRMEMTVTGSETFQCYVNIVQELIKNPAQTTDAAKAAVQKGCTPLMRAFLSTQLYAQNPPMFMDEFKKYRTELKEALPGSKYASTYENIINQLEQQLAAQTGGGAPAEEAGPVQVGMQAPEISLPDPKGKVRSLSSLKGKVVLLDFWASWCGPCRRANPHVVEMYKKYKSRGFEVFSVSLDRPDGKDKWIQAIQQDGLIWDNHVSDLKFWDSAPAATYGVRSIPRTFLINREGKIVAVNPRDNLEGELSKNL